MQVNVALNVSEITSRVKVITPEVIITNVKVTVIEVTMYYTKHKLPYYTTASQHRIEVSEITSRVMVIKQEVRGYQYKYQGHHDKGQNS